MRKSRVIRDKERSHEFMNKQEFLFERSSRRKSSEFEQVKEIFDIDSIDIPEQTMNQMKHSIRRSRDRSSDRKRERDDREDYRDARTGTRRDARDGARDGARGDAADSAADMHMKDV